MSHSAPPVSTMETLESRVFLSADPGNSRSAAMNLGALSGKITASNAVSRSDKNDYFKFKLSAARTVTATLSGLSADADLQLLSNKGAVLGSSSRKGNASESIHQQLGKGAYFLRVFPRTSASARYKLSLASSASTGSTGNAAVPVAAGTYTGTASSTVYYTGDGIFQGPYSYSYQRPTSVRIGNPLSVPAVHQAETNAFNLFIYPTHASSQGVNGDIYARSADVSVFGQGAQDRLLIQSWTIAATSGGFTARLTADHSGESLNGQEFWAPAEIVPGRPDMGVYTSPFSMYDARYGTGYQGVMTASVSGKKLSIHLESWGHFGGSSLARLVSDIVVTR